LGPSEGEDVNSTKIQSEAYKHPRKTNREHREGAEKEIWRESARKLDSRKHRNQTGSFRKSLIGKSDPKEYKRRNLLPMFKVDGGTQTVTSPPRG